MKITDLQLPDVKLITPRVFEDERGFFMETFNEQAFKDAGLTHTFVQDNHSKSQKGTLRGLHYQLAPNAQAKLVRCTQGEIFDVAVDIRPDSPTFGHWVGQILNEENKMMLLIPGDFAHGFYVISDTCEVQYKCSAGYAPELERGIRWDDPILNIHWPIPKGETPILSEKDKNADFLNHSPDQSV